MCILLESLSYEMETRQKVDAVIYTENPPPFVKYMMMMTTYSTMQKNMIHLAINLDMTHAILMVLDFSKREERAIL